MKNKVLLILILILAFCLRLAGFNWDSGFHFHPDERMLIMVAERITFWTQLNPDFFNYGSLPVYLLRGTSQLLDLIFNSTLANYDGMLFVGRSLSTIADLIVVFLIYHISFHISHKKTIALWSSFFYAVAFFPIQNSHFFIVDTFLNLFSTLLIYLLLMYRDQPSYKKVCMIGIVFAAALTSKISAVIFLPVIGLTFILPFEKHENIFQKIFDLFQRKSTKIRPYILYSLFNILIFSTGTLIFGFLFMPYAFIENVRFFSDISQQVKMNSDAYIFPYTLQYVGTLPYWYYVKNIFIWGLGPVISTLAIIGIIVCIRKYLPYFPSLPRRGIEGVVSFTIFLLFYLIYFIIIGKSAVKFMR
ncbi:MAG: glycosyltransferase family 39 protein, partial [Candidatus Roizmanbacteria bacterium]|nr:glycosyltransferase family 39 protein [Candidatus Roizmanbacteria bacterium]